MISFDGEDNDIYWNLGQKNTERGKRKALFGMGCRARGTRIAGVMRMKEGGEGGK